jgi:hypothetical protein
MVVLGIDAAWTKTEPSGVAIVVGDGEQWTCCGLAPSYSQFYELAAGKAVKWTQRAPPAPIDVEQLLSAAARRRQHVA